jgi:hypothetical protein
MPPPQPANQHLLNATESAAMDDFFTAFDVNHDPTNNMMMPQPGHMPQYGGGPNYMGIPPTFVGSDSFLEPDVREVQDYHLDNFSFHNMIPGLDIHARPGMHPDQSGSMITNGTRPPALRPVYSNSFQQQPYQPHGQPLQTPGRGPVPNFGSDNQFQPTGYSHEPEQFYPSAALDEQQWLPSNPATRPNTQPSSPMLPRKRTLDDPQYPQRNGFQPSPRNVVRNGSYSANVPQMATPQVMKTELGMTPRSSLSETPTQIHSDSDAGAESDTEYPPPTTTHNSAKKARTAKSEQSVQQKPGKRKSTSKSGSASATKAISAPPKPSRRGSSNQPRRQPLSSDQKKANHTNSEQRRRDANARAQARLFDMVPEIRNATQKQSTVQKLQRVVAFVPEVSDMRKDMQASLNGFTGNSDSGAVGFGLGITDATATAAAGTLAGMGGSMFSEHDTY